MAVWDEAAEDVLISLVQERPALYNTSKYRYDNRVAKDKFWRELEARLVVSEKELRKRWVSLRSQYVHYRRLVTSGSRGTQMTYRQQWILDRLQFLEPHIVTKESTSSPNISDRMSKENEDLKIEKTFSVKHEDTEKQTDMITLREGSQEMNVAEEKDRCEKLDFMTAGQATETTSSGNRAQPCPYICGQCGKSFGTKVKIYQHLRIHSKKNKCQECKESFPDRQQLKDHVRIHLGKKRFMCNLCGKSCLRKEELKLHLRIHIGIKPYSCSQCGKRYTQKHHIKIHMRIHTGEKPFTCTQCGKSFTSKELLKSHMRVHTREKPFPCPLCGKHLSKKASLKIHMRLHTGERPYKCLWCEKSFTYPQELKDHLRTHSRKEFL
uniref:Uncharacterized protein n=2 Tax=Cyprinus carpio carpio TaxID=630221 RepID=A0A9J7YFS5_CYPCA